MANLISNDPELGPYFAKCLAEGGINIEGLTIKDGVFYVGLRAPNRFDSSPIIEIAVRELFGNSSSLSALFDRKKEELDYRVHWVDLGKSNLGIREISTINNGFALLVGASRDQTTPYQLHFWDGQSEQSQLWVADFDKAQNINQDKSMSSFFSTSSGKAEGMLVLQESEQSLDILLLFDGVYKGEPQVFRIEKNKKSSEQHGHQAFSWIAHMYIYLRGFLASL